MNTRTSPPPSSSTALGQLVSTRHQPESTTRTTTTTTTTTHQRRLIPATKTLLPLNRTSPTLDQATEEDNYAELEIMPSTTTSVTTTTTVLTTHFAPLRIPKSRPLRPVASHQEQLRDLLEEREGESSKAGGPGTRALELDSKVYPLSGLEWNKTGGYGAGAIGNFKLELGEMEARFVHDTNVGSGRRASEGSAKGKGKERERGISGVTNSAREKTGSGKGVGMGEVQEGGRRESTVSGMERERRNSTRISPGPPPRKRPRSDSSQRGGGGERGGGGDEIVTGGRRSSVNPHSLPSPNQSPPSPVPTSSGGEESQDTSLVIEEEEQQGTTSPSIQVPGQQSFNFGSTPSLSALLSLPDLVDTFDQLSPSLQSYMIFTLLQRSPIPVLQTVANIIAPALRRDFLTDLPPELSVQILGYLDPKTLCRASLVCKSWRRLVDGEWRIWKKMMDFDGLWIGDGSEERDAREIVTGKKENWFLERWRAGVWEEKKTTTWNGKVEPDQVYIDGVTQHARRPSISNSSVRLASPSSSREPSPTLPEPEPHNVHPYKILYRRRWLTRRNWKRAEPRRTTFSSSTATTNVVTCLQFDEEKIVSASDDADHSIHVFDTQSGMERAELRGHEGGVWALQYIGNVLVSGSTDRTVRVWDLDSAKCTHEFIGHTSTVRCLQIVEPINVNPDSKGEPIWEPPYPLVVTGSRDWSLRVWKLPFAGKDREYHPAVPMSPTEGATSEPTDNPFYERQLSGHRGAVRAVAASGRTVVSGSYDHKVRVWDLLTGECRHVLEGHSQKVYSVVIDPGRGRCASGSMDGTVKLWSLETGEILNSLDGHSSLVGLLGLSHRCLVSAAADWTLRIWNPETGECRHALNAHQGAITCFQHDEYKIVSGSDGTLKMWDTQTGEFVRDLLANLTGVWQVAFNQRYCVAAVQRNGSSEFELLDFGAVDQDEIKPVLEAEPTQPFQNPSPSANDDDDVDMPDSNASVRPLSTTTPLATTSSTSSSSRNPPPLRGPSQIPRFRSNDSTTTPDNQSHLSTTRTVRHVDSSRNLGDRVESAMLRGSNDSPSVQGGGGVSTMDVDDEGAVEASTRVWARRSEGGGGEDEESSGNGVEGEEGGNESFEVEGEED